MTTLLVASAGGHLTQLHQLRPRLGGVDPEVIWVTFDTAQSRSLLEGERVEFVEHTVTRDWKNIIGNTRPALKLMRREPITAVVSSGAGIALSYLPLARARRLPAHYIESATRSTGPSLSGRILQHVPGIRLYTQHEPLVRGRWHYAGSVFDGYVTSPRPERPIRRVVVTLGAHESFGFRRLVEKLIEVLPAGADVLWQTGSTDVTGLGIDAAAAIPAAELRAAIAAADVVVAHAGTGSAITALDAGHVPLLVPREPRHGEHVDDHQFQIAADLARRGLAVTRTVDELTSADLAAAAARAVSRSADPRPFNLL